MAETPINLNKHRKARSRAEARRKADENAVRFGRSKAEKTRDAAEKARADRQAESHRIDRDPD